jgi:REP element-mobilizing transposase RayT
MSRNYKFLNADGLHFVSFATVFWIDVFVRRVYFECIVENLNFCGEQKGMEIYAWCVMPSHNSFSVPADSSETR